VPWFLATPRLPRQLAFGYSGFGRTGPEWARFTGDDGSWCAVRMQQDDHGLREVRGGGPLAIWAAYERVHDEWEALGRPAWDRLGLTVTPDGAHRVWLDDPESAHTWELPALRAGRSAGEITSRAAAPAPPGPHRTGA
jgi:hypothetical protein